VEDLVMGRRQGQLATQSAGRKATTQPPAVPAAALSQRTQTTTPSVISSAGNQATNTALTSAPNTDVELYNAMMAKGSIQPRFGTPFQSMGRGTSRSLLATSPGQNPAAALQSLAEARSETDVALNPRGYPHKGELRFGDTQQPVTTEQLVNWAVKHGGTPKGIYASLLNSYDFFGSEDARRNAANVLAAHMSDVQSAIRQRQAEDEAAAEADYQKKGAAREPIPGHNLISLKELQKLQTNPQFSEPLETVHFSTQRPVTYVRGQTISGYNIVSPQWGVVEKDGYYYQVGEPGLDALNFGYHPSQNLTTARQVWEGSKGVNVAYGYVLKYAGKALQFAPALGRLAAPFIERSGEGILYDVKATDAKLRGEDFNEPAPEINLDTLKEGIAGAVAPEVGGKAAGAIEKHLGPTLGRAAPIVGAATGSVATQYTSQVIEGVPDVIQGKASIADVATPHVSASSVAQDLALPAAHRGAGKLADKLAPARTLRGEPGPQGAIAEHPARPHEARTSSSTTGQPRAGAAEPEPHESGGFEPPVGRPPPQRPGEAPDPHRDLYEKVVATRGFDSAPGVGQHAGLQERYEQLKKQLPPDIAPKPETQANPDLEWKQLTRDMEWKRKKLQGDARALAKEVTKLQRRKKLSAEDQTRLDDFTKKLETTRRERDNFKQLEQDIKRTRNKLAVSRPQHPDAPSDATAVSKGGALGKWHDTYVAIRIVKTADGSEVATVLEKFDSEAAKRAQQQRKRQGGEQRPDERHAEEKGLPALEAELARLRAAQIAEGKPGQDLTKDLSGYTIEVVGDREVCERVCRPELRKFAGKYNADSVTGYTYTGKSPSGETFPDKRAAVLRSSQAAEGLELTKQTLDIYRRGDGQGGGGDGGHAHGQVTRTPKKSAEPPTAKGDSKGAPAPRSGEDPDRAVTTTPRTRAKVAPRRRPKAAGTASPAENTPADKPPRAKPAAKNQPASPPAKPAAPRKTRRSAEPAAAEQQSAPAPATSPTIAPGPEEATAGGPAAETGRARQRSRRASSTPTHGRGSKPPAIEAKKQQARSAPTESDKATMPTPEPTGDAAPRRPAAAKAEEPAMARAEAQGREVKAPELAKPAAQTSATAKAQARSAMPEHAQPVVREPGGAPTKTKSPKPARTSPTRGEKVAGALGKADAVLGAVRDYQQYKADGASEAAALARSGTTLAANLKGGPAAGIVNAANAYDNARRSGQGKLEATATALGTAGGGIIASKVAPAGPVGTAVNLANTAAQALGAPQGVQDATTGAAALVPSNIVATTVTEGARSYANLGTALVTGDTKALDKQVQGFQAGSAGPWLQGYAQMTGMVADMAAGDNFETALNKAAASGKGSWADRVGSKGGDSLYELGQSKEAKSGKYGASVQGISMALGITSDMIAGQSFEQALNKAAEAGKGSWPEKVGSALGDAAWDATEKTRQLVNEGLPAAKHAIKAKWNKLWS
jgi:hypothetical protein